MDSATKKAKRKQEELERAQAWAKAEAAKKSSTAATTPARPTKRRKSEGPSSSSSATTKKGDAKERAKQWAESQGIIHNQNKPSPTTKPTASSASKKKASASGNDSLASAQKWANQQGISLEENDEDDDDDVVMKDTTTTQKPTAQETQQAPLVAPAQPYISAAVAVAPSRPVSRRDPPSEAPAAAVAPPQPATATGSTVEPNRRRRDDTVPSEPPIVLRVNDDPPVDPVVEEEGDSEPAVPPKGQHQGSLLVPLALLGAILSIGLGMVFSPYLNSSASPSLSTAVLPCFVDNMFSDEQLDAHDTETGTIPKDIPPHCIGVDTRTACPGTCLNGVLVACPKPYTFMNDNASACRLTHKSKGQLHALTRWVITQTKACGNLPICPQPSFLDTWLGPDHPVFDLEQVLQDVPQVAEWTVETAKRVVGADPNESTLAVVPTTSKDDDDEAAPASVVWGVALNPEAAVPTGGLSTGRRLVQNMGFSVLFLLTSMGNLWMNWFHVAPWATVAITVTVVIGCIVRIAIVHHTRQVPAAATE